MPFGDSFKFATLEGRRMRLMRGQVVIREERAAARLDGLWVPDANPDHTHTHVGTVLSLGPPALCCTVDKMGRCVSRTCKHVEVPHHFDVGDRVIYHFIHHQSAWTMPWTDGRPATYVPQTCVDAVIEAVRS